jgi:hypothetical protein
MGEYKFADALSLPKIPSLFPANSLRHLPLGRQKARMAHFREA